MSDHMILLYPPPGSRASRYYAFCICGSYRSKEYAFPGHAENAGLQHVKAKTATGGAR